VRKKVLAVVLAVLAFSLIAASAATLGGINAADIGADTTLVASCNGGNGPVDVSWDSVEYDSAANEFEVTEFTVTFLDDSCDGDPITVTLAQGNGTELATVTGSVSGTAVTFDDTDFGGVSAELLRRVAIVVG